LFSFRPLSRWLGFLTRLKNKLQNPVNVFPYPFEVTGVSYCMDAARPEIPLRCSFRPLSR